MVEAQQMKDPMNEQEGTFLLERFTGLTGLPLSGLKRYGHITQQAASAGPAYNLILGKRDDIRRPVFFEVGTIEFPDPLLVKQQDAQFTLLTAQVF